MGNISKLCKTCRQVHPTVNAVGDPPPEKCPICGNILVEYTGSLKPAQKVGEEELTIEFDDSVSHEGRKGVVEVLQGGAMVKHTSVSDLEPPDDTYVRKSV